PILMTSLATLVAALPPALAIGPGAETRVPMAIAVVGGVFFSTLLTLFVVPAMYFLFLRRGRSQRGHPTLIKLLSIQLVIKAAFILLQFKVDFISYWDE
ncbi:MAG: efflux RND transporter permease subunit, partial [Deltaproteobacteria bacterium]